MQDLCGIISIFIDASIKKYPDRGKEELPALLENNDRPTNQKHGVPPDMPSVVGPSKHTLIHHRGKVTPRYLVCGEESCKKLQTLLGQ